MASTSKRADNAAPLGKEDAALLLIKGVNFLMAQAMEAGLGTATRILGVAREDLVYWTADQGLVESKQEQFIYRQLFDSGLFPAAGIIQKIEGIQDAGLRDRICGLFGLRSVQGTAKRAADRAQA